MQTHALAIEEFSEETYTLIAIHTTLEDYKLAYQLNNSLGTHFEMSPEKLDFKTESSPLSFVVYEYCSEQFDIDWYLIANTCKTTEKQDVGGLNLETESKSYLIREMKNIDYFIKINEETEKSVLQNTLDKINSINQVVTSYSIDPNSLKSKDFLIF